MRKKPKYIAEYYVFKTIGIITGIIFSIQILPLMLLFLIIGLYNSNCKGFGCDGCTCSGCDYSTEPKLFTGIIIWIVEISILAAITVICFKKASDYKIFENPEIEENPENKENQQ